MNNSVIVLVEHLKKEIADITYEMLGIGRKIADGLNIPLYAAIFGNDIGTLTSSLGIADIVFTIDKDALEMPSPEVTAGLLKNVIEQKGASILLVGSTNVTAGVGPLLSLKANLPFYNFCKNLVIENQTITVSSQLFGGKILSDTILTDNKGIISVYPGSFPIDAGKSDKIPASEVLDYALIESKNIFKKFIEPEAGDVDITKENILVSVGRGIGNADNLAIAEDLLASLGGGAICASRPVIDQGWLPLSRQVGKSGMIVKPKLYMALGISGAPEHIEGMKDSELIIAINKDPNAPIFNIAHYGVCADLNDIIPTMVDALKSRK